MTDIVVENMPGGEMHLHVIVDEARGLTYHAASAGHHLMTAVEAKCQMQQMMIKHMGNELLKAVDQLDKFYDYEFKGTSLDDTE